MADSQRADQHREDLFVCQFGEEACSSGHAYGPAVRDHVLIHFVASGKGVFICQNQKFAVQAGQCFFIYPDEESFYQADQKEPWHYAWVGFRGRQALALIAQAGFSPKQRVYTASDAQEAWKTLEIMRHDAKTLRLNQLALVGSLLRFLSLLSSGSDSTAFLTPAQQYCERAVWFLEGRYARDVSIQETADFAGLSRSHLYRMMMDTYGMSPKEMLQKIRMRHVEKLLAETSLTLDEIALRTGFRTGAQLGVSFRKAYGITPGAFRKGK